MERTTREMFTTVVGNFSFRNRSDIDLDKTINKLDPMNNREDLYFFHEYFKYFIEFDYIFDHKNFSRF